MASKKKVEEKVVKAEEKKEEVVIPTIVKSPRELQMEYDLQMVTGRFMCHEPKGGSVTFFKKKYKEEGTPKKYEMVDGNNYTVPRYVAVDLNDTGWEVHSHILNADGKPTVNTGKKERRFTFESLEFI